MKTREAVITAVITFSTEVEVDEFGKVVEWQDDYCIGEMENICFDEIMSNELIGD